jgi:uncharacterized protein YqgQ
LQKATVTFVMTVFLFFRPCAWKNSAVTRKNFKKFGISIFFENLLRKFKFKKKELTRITGMLDENLFAFMRNVSGRSCRENQNTFHFQLFFFPENLAVYEIMWQNMVKPARQHMTM